MRVSMNWLRELISLPEGTTTQEVADRLTSAGLQVERIEQLGDLTGPIVVGRVLEFSPEPQKNGKVINWCSVDVGETEPRGIVCGAHNFAVNDLVVVALPGAILPGDFEIAARKTYGHVSDGMMCAVDELGLGSDHEGIIILPQGAAVPGDDALAVLHAKDEVLEIDVTPDIGCYALSMRGIAREVAQAFGVDYTDPYQVQLPTPRTDGHPVELADEGCDAFTALSLVGFKPESATPLWMSARLAAAGMRSISLAVDITNYVMLESGQPLHAYDADKLSGPIVVRRAQPGEQLITLDDATRKLDAEDLLITDDSGPIGMAGVMGGASTEIEAGTTNIVLEAAHFDPILVGRTFRRHKLPSEAATRFSRGVDPQLSFAAAQRAAQLMCELGGASLSEDYTLVGEPVDRPQQTISAELPGKVLGIDLTPTRVIEILAASGVQVDVDGLHLTLTPPSWRADLVDKYDYVEEIARKVGLDALESVVPRAAAGRGLSREQKARRLIINAAVQAGFVEVLTLPFVGSDELTKLGLASEDARNKLIRLANPLADTQPYLRSTLLPGLFAAVAKNRSRSQDDLSLFECGSVFRAGDQGPAAMLDVSQRPSDEEVTALLGAIPDQPRMIAAVLTGNWRPTTWRGAAEPADWRHAIALADQLAATIGLRLDREAAQLAPWHPGRCAALHARDQIIGYAGELHPNVVAAFGLPARACAVEIDLDALIAAAPLGGSVAPLSAYPLVKQDVALIVDDAIPAAKVQAALVEGCGELLEQVALFDIYTGPQAGEGKKSLAFALGFRALDRTLTEAEAAEARQAGVDLAAERFGAVQRA